MTKSNGERATVEAKDRRRSDEAVTFSNTKIESRAAAAVYTVAPAIPADAPAAASDEADTEDRVAMLAAIAADPTAWVIAIEARDDRGPDTVMYVTTTIEFARARCLSFGLNEYEGDIRYHLVPHRLDAPRDDHETGTVSIAVYGTRKGSTAIEDLVGTEDAYPR